MSICKTHGRGESAAPGDLRRSARGTEGALCSAQGNGAIKDTVDCSVFSVWF